jgi:hypothetical protein
VHAIWRLVSKEQAKTRQHQIEFVLDAFSKVGIIFDPENETDAKWLEALKQRYTLVPIALYGPHFRIQDKKSRLATEQLLLKLEEVRSALLLCEKEAERGDLPNRKQNVALRVKRELYELQTIWKRVRAEDYEQSQWIKDFNVKIDELSWSAACALNVGVYTPHGRSKILLEYTFFVHRLYDFWRAKESTIGVYKSGGRWTGPFVEVVEKCEELIPIDLRPPSANARGKRVARAIGAHKKANPS